MSERLARDDVLGKVLETAHRLKAYSCYGGKKANAVRALRRRCPGWDKDELEDLLTRGIAVQESVRGWLAEHEKEVYEQWQRSEPFGAIAASFHEAHPGWPKTELDSLLAINFLYFYLK